MLVSECMYVCEHMRICFCRCVNVSIYVVFSANQMVCANSKKKEKKLHRQKESSSTDFFVPFNMWYAFGEMLECYGTNIARIHFTPISNVTLRNVSHTCHICHTFHPYMCSNRTIKSWTKCWHSFKSSTKKSISYEIGQSKRTLKRNSYCAYFEQRFTIELSEREWKGAQVKDENQEWL